MSRHSIQNSLAHSLTHIHPSMCSRCGHHVEEGAGGMVKKCGGEASQDSKHRFEKPFERYTTLLIDWTAGEQTIWHRSGSAVSRAIHLCIRGVHPTSYQLYYPASSQWVFCHTTCCSLLRKAVRCPAIIVRLPSIRRSSAHLCAGTCCFGVLTVLV